MIYQKVFDTMHIISVLKLTFGIAYAGAIGKSIGSRAASANPKITYLLLKGWSSQLVPKNKQEHINICQQVKKTLKSFSWRTKAHTIQTMYSTTLSSKHSSIYFALLFFHRCRIHSKKVNI